jgi:pimeloyl-ACP methyl ester carboxylesterase
MNEVVYCISGLGADQRIFDNLRLEGYELRYIPWVVPTKNESLEHYAQRMIDGFDLDHAALIGVSFGGMLGIEIAKKVPLKKLFIISSIKTRNELPRWMQWSGKLRLNKLVPTRSFRFADQLNDKRLGVSNSAERQMVRAYRRAANPVYVQWAINQVVNWKNEWTPDHLTHIHGDSDKMFPITRITAHHLIPGGTHMMIYNRAADIARIIGEELHQ